jgi:hypothetical protein
MILATALSLRDFHPRSIVSNCVDEATPMDSIVIAQACGLFFPRVSFVVQRQVAPRRGKTHVGAFRLDAL